MTFPRVFNPQKVQERLLTAVARAIAKGNHAKSTRKPFMGNSARIPAEEERKERKKAGKNPLPIRF